MCLVEQKVKNLSLFGLGSFCCKLGLLKSDCVHNMSEKLNHTNYIFFYKKKHIFCVEFLRSNMAKKSQKVAILHQ